MKHKSLFLVAFGLAAGLGAGAQETRHLTMDEAISMSLSASKQLRVSQLKITEAASNLKEARERRLPDISVSGAYLRVAQPTIDLKVKLGGSQNSSGNTEGTQTSSPTVNQAAYGIANLSVPIFTGGKINSGIESAKYLEQAAKLDASYDRQGIVQNTIAAYSNLYKASAAVRLVRENLRQSQQRVADFSHLETNGLLARNDLLKAQLQQSNIELSLLDAENNFNLAIANMDIMLGLPEGTVLETDTAFTQPVSEKNMVEWESLAIQNRMDLSALAQRRKAAEQGVRNAKGGYYPNIALTGGYIAAYVPNFITITNALNAGVGLSYTPSSLWKGSNTLTQAKARVQEAALGQEQLSDAIRLQIASAYENFLLAQKKIDVYQKAEDQAAENYRIVKNKYDNSLATATDLLEADIAQLQSKLNYAFATADAAVAYHKLLQTAGSDTYNN